MDLKFVLIILSAILLNSMIAAIPETTGNNVCELAQQQNPDLIIENGTQFRQGTCVETFMGQVPDADHMTSTIILFPKDGDTLNAGEEFTIKVAVINLHTGFFDDPATQYYIFPQTLDDSGVIQGHSHVTVQLLKSDSTPPDPRVFAFFKGLNDPDIDGVLNATVPGGLKTPGSYRLCTMSSSFGHQPLLMPIAQRGSQDDCTRFTVVDSKKKVKRDFQNRHYRRS